MRFGQLNRPLRGPGYRDMIGMSGHPVRRKRYNDLRPSLHNRGENPMRQRRRVKRLQLSVRILVQHEFGDAENGASVPQFLFPEPGQFFAGSESELPDLPCIPRWRMRESRHGPHCLAWLSSLRRQRIRHRDGRRRIAILSSFPFSLPLFIGCPPEMWMAQPYHWRFPSPLSPNKIIPWR